MTLGFSTTHSNGSPTLFEQKILLPHKPEIRQAFPNLLPKIHTFRLGNRWKAGMEMHMVTGNRTPQRRQFNLGIPALQYCHGVQTCIIRTVNIPMKAFSIEVDGKEVNELLFAVNDGFDGPDQFFDWFGHPFKPTLHEGQIVHFTDFRY